MPVWWIGGALAAPDALSLATGLVEGTGPRPSGSEAVQQALARVEAQLESTGWEPRRWTGPAAGGVFACREGRSAERVVFFAHLDSVHAGVPGANDNAAAVGVLLELAGRLEEGSTLRTVCLVFPDGEEIGLRGSRRILELGLLEPVDQVVALDLVGRGTPTHNGLSGRLSASDARALLRAAPADVPWIYRAFSLGLPHMERSDHGPWTRAGYVATHLLSRAESGVYWAYHTPLDTPDQLEPATLARMVDLVEGIARMPPVDGDGDDEPWFVVPWTRWVAPGWVTWTLLALGALAAAVPFAGFLPRRASVDAGAGGSALTVPAALLGGALGVALAAVGTEIGGNAATPAVWAFWLGWGAGLLALGGGPGLAWIRVATVLTALAGALMVWAGLVLLAVPAAGVLVGLGLAAVSVRRALRAPGSDGPSGPGPGGGLASGSPARPDRVGQALLAAGVLLASWPAAYLVRPAAIRELAFHGFVSPDAQSWAVAAPLLALPVTTVLATRVPRHRTAALAAAGLAVVGVLVAHGLPARSGVFDVPPMLRPEVQRSSPLPGAGDAIP